MKSKPYAHTLMIIILLRLNESKFFYDLYVPRDISCASVLADNVQESEAGHSSGQSLQTDETRTDVRCQR